MSAVSRMKSQMIKQNKTHSKRAKLIFLIAIERILKQYRIINEKYQKNLITLKIACIIKTSDNILSHDEIF